MKVLQIITHLELGGAQRATLNLSRWLESNGYDITLISSRSGLLYREAKNNFKNKFKELKVLKREINPLCDLIAFFSLYIFIKENNFDIVHTHTSKAGIIGRWAAFFCFGPKVVHTVHGFAFHDYQNLFLRQFYVFLERITAVITDKIIAVSEEVKNKGIKYKIGSENKYVVVYELVNVKRGTKKTSSGGDRFKIGMVAALKVQKAPQDFIRAASILSLKRKDVEFLLVGDGKLRPEMNKLVKKYNLIDNFRFLGWRENIYAIMSEFDVLILPSLFEGQPHVVIEAMALGIPVIASKVDGVKDLIKDGENGFLLEPRKPSQIANKVAELLNDSQLRERISARAYEYFCQEKKLDYVSNLIKTEKIYKEIKN